MNHVELAARDNTSPWPGARVYRLACPHGVSSATVLPGANGLAERVVLDLMLPGHQIRHRCTCEPTAEPTAEAAAEAAARPVVPIPLPV